MKLEEQPGREDGVRVLAGRGELDVTAVPAILPGVSALVAGARAVVLDLTELEFFDSAGVRLVDQLARECARRAEPFAVVAPTGGPSRRVLDLVGLSEPLVVDDLAAALERVQRG